MVAFRNLRFVLERLEELRQIDDQKTFPGLTEDSIVIEGRDQNETQIHKESKVVKHFTTVFIAAAQSLGCKSFWCISARTRRPLALCLYFT